MENLYTKILNNPFTKGYERFSIERMLVISSENSDRLIYLEMPMDLQSKQDSFFFGKACLFDQERAYLLDDLEKAASKQIQSGKIVSVVYHIEGYNGIYRCHIGDAITLDAAQDVVKQLSFMPGHFERCWHISTQHLSRFAFTLLQELFYEKNPDNTLLEVFPMHNGQSIGIQFFYSKSLHRRMHLQNKLYAFSDCKDKLDRLFRNPPPECLIDVLTLAYIARTSVLIISDQYPVVQGLPTFDI